MPNHKFIFILLMFFATLSFGSDEEGDFRLGYSPVGFGNNSIDVAFFHVEIFNNYGFGYGFEFFRYSFINEKNYTTWINPMLLWNPLPRVADKSDYSPNVGLFVLTHYPAFIYDEERRDYKNFIILTGLRLTLPMRLYLFHVEGGYRLIRKDNKASGFYFSVKTDPIVDLIAAMMYFGDGRK